MRHGTSLLAICKSAMLSATNTARSAASHESALPGMVTTPWSVCTLTTLRTIGAELSADGSYLVDEGFKQNAVPTIASVATTIVNRDQCISRFICFLLATNHAWYELQRNCHTTYER